jgi:hypothetical protein
MKSPAMVALLSLLLAISVLTSLTLSHVWWGWLIATVILFPLALGAAGFVKIRKSDNPTPACFSMMSLFTLVILIPDMQEAHGAGTAREWIGVAVNTVVDIILLVILWHSLLERNKKNRN